NTLKKQWTAQKDDLAKHPVRADLQAAPGAYRVRVAAVDATGRAGTTDYDLKAETARADPLRLSALVVASSSDGVALATAETQIGKGSAEDARMAIGGFGIDSLPPGDYLMRAIVSLNGKSVGRVMRTMRKAK